MQSNKAKYDQKEHKFVCIITGKGGHGAMPENAKDPVVAAAMLVSELGKIKLDADVTWTQIHGGTRFNIIPETVELQGTILSPVCSIQENEARIQDTGNAVAEAMGVKCKWNFSSLQ